MSNKNIIDLHETTTTMYVANGGLSKSLQASVDNYVRYAGLDQFKRAALRYRCRTFENEGLKDKCKVLKFKGKNYE